VGHFRHNRVNPGDVIQVRVIVRVYSTPILILRVSSDLGLKGRHLRKPGQN